MVRSEFWAIMLSFILTIFAIAGIILMIVFFSWLSANFTFEVIVKHVFDIFAIALFIGIIWAGIYDKIKKE